MDNTDLQQQLQRSLTDFLWDQWVALGMAGHASGRPVPFVIDPEALLLATLHFSMNEARFRGEVLDWLERNGGLLSVQRIKNLQAYANLSPPGQIRGIAAFMESRGHSNWKSIASADAPSAASDFTGHTLRGLSQTPDPSKPEAFMLRMRQLFGVNARVEILTWLFTHHEGHSAYIARDTAWFPKSVQAILNDLEKAAIVHSHIDGKRRTYALSNHGSIWHAEFGKGLQWFNQAKFYEGMSHVMNTLQTANDASLSAAAHAIAIRNQLEPLRSAFHMANLDPFFASTRNQHGETLVDAFHTGCLSLINLLDRRS